MKFALQSISSLGVVLLGFLLLANVGVTSAGRGELESLSSVERAVITETIQADGTVVEIDELTTLVKSQLVVDTESQADLPYNSTLSKLEVLEAYTITLPKYPVIGPFNHVITYIPAWDLYLDSTAEMAPFGTLPSSEIDKPTLLTKFAKVGHTPKPKKEDSKILTGITMQIERDGRIKGKTHTMYFGSAEINARYRYEGAETTLSEKLVRSDLAKFRQTGEGTRRVALSMNLLTKNLRT